MHLPDCSVFCSARDDADGHFECDRDGNRVCLEGFRNASTDCTECVPAAGCCKEHELVQSHCYYHQSINTKQSLPIAAI